MFFSIKAITDETKKRKVRCSALHKNFHMEYHCVLAVRINLLRTQVCLRHSLNTFKVWGSQNRNFFQADSCFAPQFCRRWWSYVEPGQVAAKRRSVALLKSSSIFTFPKKSPALSSMDNMRDLYLFDQFSVKAQLFLLNMERKRHDWFRKVFTFSIRHQTCYIFYVFQFMQVSQLPENTSRK